MIADNEFAEQFLDDMESEELTWHNWLQDKHKKQRELCEKNFKLYKQYKLKVVK